MKILVTFSIDKEQKERLELNIPKGNTIVYKSPLEVNEEDIKDVDILLGNVLPKYLKYAKKLKWMQLFNAGTDGYCGEGILAEGVILTNATGAFGEAISEHMLSVMFMLRKKINHYYDNQKKSKWEFFEHMDMISGSTVLCLGLGDIGSTFAKKAKALGCYVIGVKRRKTKCPPYVDELYTIDELDKIISRADTVAMSMPANDSTRNIINEKTLKLMKNNAIILNVGRGSAIDTDALIEALKNKEIYGAGLDVTSPEPLPEDSELWHMDNVIITPHVSGLSELPYTQEKIVDIFIYNLNAYFKQEKMKNVIDMTTGYCI